MYRTGNEIQGMLIGGLVLFAVIAVLGIFGLSRVTGLPIMDLLDNAHPILIGPGLCLVVWAIERFEVPLPIRFDNTWPITIGAFWIGIHTLIVLKAESVGALPLLPVSVLSYTNDIYEDAKDLPWYASNFFCFAVFAVITAGGYWVRAKRNRYY